MRYGLQACTIVRTFILGHSAKPWSLSATYSPMTEMDDVTGYYADCYVLSERRDVDTVRSFYREFLPGWAGKEDNIFYLGEGEGQTFHSTQAALEYLEHNRTETYSIVSHGAAETMFKGLQIHFTSDGNIIYGAYCDTKYPDTEFEEHLLKRIKRFVGSESGYIAYETPPALTKDEFLAQVAAH